MALGTVAPPDAGPAPAPPPSDAPTGRRPGARAFLRWSAGAYLGVTLLMVAAMVARTGLPLTYVLDDPAIHLNMARQLAGHGTWGVAPGSFESASSAPLWTLLLTPFAALGAPVRDGAPLALNVVAGLGALVVLAGPGSVLRPSRRRPVEAAVAVVLAVVVLFLPGLAVVGMEHSLHVALVLAAVALFTDRAAGWRRGPAWAPYALLALATLARFETAFVALGLAVGLVADAVAAPGAGRRAWGPALRPAAAVVAASGGAIAAFAAVNLALGGGPLPNSVLAKGQVTGSAEADGLAPVEITHRLTQDPMVAAAFVLAVAYLALTWGRGRARGRLAACATAVATLAHAAVADVGWYDRYQSYLLALGAYLGLVALGELPIAHRRRLLVAALVVAVPLAVPKLDLLRDAPTAAADMAGHHRLAGRFLDRYYDGQPVATTQLGYIGLLHDGPITDFVGLGDHEVLEMPDGGADRWGEVVAARGVRVAVVYAPEAFRSVPDDWVRVGSFRLDHEPVTAVSRDLEVFATSVDEVAPLERRLTEFAADVPDGVEVRLNEFAGLQAAAIEADAAG